MGHWTFVMAAYGVATAILLGYWWRVERRLRALETRMASRGRP
jgi:hypothetical protein